MTRVPVNPKLLKWARERAGYSVSALAVRFPRLEAWENGEVQPTIKQLEAFAKATRTPIGFLFLAEPPVEQFPIPDFRTVANVSPERPSPDLLDTIYLCQQRQDWYRDFARSALEGPLELVGSASVGHDVAETAARMRRALRVHLDERKKLATWTDALRRLIENADALGILVMVSGVVGSNSRRKLDPQEFRGFALVDPWAPLVFINGADTKAAQMFTLAHELAHIWLGKSGVSDTNPSAVPDQESERWCNRVAAELLVPLEVFRSELDLHADLHFELNRLARRFKVSTLVILRRIHDAGQLSYDELWAAYDAELSRLRRSPTGAGGDFYRTLGARVSKRFARALVESTLEGRTSFTETFRMLGLKKMATFSKLGRSLEVGHL
jgi:Zn-dependent peptidase ImmA (M78 family)